MTDKNFNTELEQAARVALALRERAESALDTANGATSFVDIASGDALVMVMGFAKLAERAVTTSEKLNGIASRWESRAAGLKSMRSVIGNEKAEALIECAAVVRDLAGRIGNGNQ